MDARVDWKRKQQKQRALWEASQQASDSGSYKSIVKTYIESLMLIPSESKILSDTLQVKLRLSQQGKSTRNGYKEYIRAVLPRFSQSQIQLVPSCTMNRSYLHRKAAEARITLLRGTRWKKSNKSHIQEQIGPKIVSPLRGFLLLIIIILQSDHRLRNKEKKEKEKASKGQCLDKFLRKCCSF